jgi:serine/threonine protein kinase
MFAFFRCVAEAVVENGARGLAEMVPGGKYACDIAASAWKKYREKKKAEESRKEIQQIVAASVEEVRNAAVEAVAKVAEPAGVPIEDRINLELYLSQIPAAVQLSLKRTDDPKGQTVPAEFAIHSTDDVLKMLPPRPPRFRPGAPLHGKPGWQLEKLLGVGGFGEVWLARHERLTSLVGAVKFCLGQQARDLQHESGVIDRVMRAGSHPNIVPLTDVSLEGEAPWLMYEYVPGGDLGDWIRVLQSRVPEERCKQATAGLRQLTAAVAQFHKLNPPVVHRDLKPSNILLDRTNKRLRITDFGIGGIAARAALYNDTHSATQAGRLLSYLRAAHTPLYASPQQRGGSDPDPRDDVHALGVIGYQMITGHLIQGAGPDFADELREAGAHEEVVDVLRRCVSHKADRRPADASALLDLLNARPAQPQSPVSPLEAPPPVSYSASPDKSPPVPDEPTAEAKPNAPRSAIRVEAEPAPTQAITGTDFLQDAARGDAEAQYSLGLCYADGHGLPQDHAAAAGWLRKAANQNHPAAMHRLGRLYEKGLGVRKNGPSAVRWYEKAAALGDAGAQERLGALYWEGRFLPQDYALAAKWLHAAA